MQKNKFIQDEDTIDLDIQENELRQELNESINSLNENLVKLLEDDSKKEFNETLKVSLTKVIELLSQKKKEIDITPLVNKVSDQNNNILRLINGLSQTPIVIDNSKFEGVLKEVISMVNKNNLYLQSGLKQIDYTKNLEMIMEAIKNRPSWELVTQKGEYGKLITKATPIFNNKK